MFEVSKYSYLVGNLFFLLIWLILFFRTKYFKHQLLVISIFAIPLGPLSELMYRIDYWRPKLITGNIVGIEDTLFAFCIAGIGFGLYKIIFNLKYSNQKTKAYPILALILVILTIIGMVINSVFSWMNSIYFSSLCFLIGASIIFILRKDLIKLALINGALVAALMFIFYFTFLIPLYPKVFETTWLLKNISQIFIFGVPIEELLWGFSWGILAGCIYEFYKGYKFLESF